MDKFLVYDYKATQEYGGPPLENFDYENQMHLRPLHRLRLWPTFEEYWASDEISEFRINFTEYAQFRKFKYWIKDQVTFIYDLIYFSQLKIGKGNERRWN